jgi:hypothetical protein
MPCNEHSDHTEEMKFLGFDILTAVTTKSSIFWEITPCRQVKVKRVSDEHVVSIIRVEE